MNRCTAWSVWGLLGRCWASIWGLMVGCRLRDDHCVVDPQLDRQPPPTPDPPSQPPRPPYIYKQGTTTSRPIFTDFICSCGCTKLSINLDTGIRSCFSCGKVFFIPFSGISSVIQSPVPDSYDPGIISLSFTGAWRYVGES